MLLCNISYHSPRHRESHHREHRAPGAPAPRGIHHGIDAYCHEPGVAGKSLPYAQMQQMMHRPLRAAQRALQASNLMERAFEKGCRRIFGIAHEEPCYNGSNHCGCEYPVFWHLLFIFRFPLTKVMKICETHNFFTFFF